MKQKKLAPWRLIAGVLSIAAIVIMWSKKDVAAMYAGMSADAALPLAITQAAVTILKVALMAAAVLGIRWIAARFKTNK